MQTFFQVYIANVGTFCATLVKGGGSACYKNSKRQVRLHRFYPAVVAYLCVCRRNFVAHNITTKMRSKLDTANSRTAKKIRWKLTDTRYSITKYDARTPDNRSNEDEKEINEGRGKGRRGGRDRARLHKRRVYKLGTEQRYRTIDKTTVKTRKSRATMRVHGKRVGKFMEHAGSHQSWRFIGLIVTRAKRRRRRCTRSKTSLPPL